MTQIMERLKNMVGFSTVKVGEDIVPMIKPSRNLFDYIVFPYVDLTDPMNETLFRKLHDEMKQHCLRGRFSICDVRDIIELADVHLHPLPAKDYEWLHKLHCVEFKDMHPDIYAQLPQRINNVFSNGTIATQVGAG